MNPGEEPKTFRDKLSTADKTGKRLWVYAKHPKGKLYVRRSVLALILLLVFFLMPFLKVNGEPFLMLNFPARKLILFGNLFVPQDFYLFVLLMIAALVFIVLFTVVYGRLFCGWVCPQTVFMEFVYRQLEYLIEGNPHQQRTLDQQKLTFTKLWKKTLKHTLFAGISFMVINTLLSYIIGIEDLKSIYKAPVSWSALAGILIFSGIHYFVFAKFREQVCIMVCPYGRLQGVLLDKNSIMVSYHYKRGEPRASFVANENRAESGKGDCIDCGNCQFVCPTGIDIRNGTQLECINCTACIDACNTVMKRINRPQNLIGYASQRSLADETKLKVNPRIVFYSVVLTALLGLIVYLFSVRTDVEATILRVPGTLFQQYDNEHISNVYSVQLVNKTHQDVSVELKIASPEGGKIMGNPVFTVKKEEVLKTTVLITFPLKNLKSSNTPVVFEVFNQDKKIETVKSTFVGSNELDR